MKNISTRSFRGLRGAFLLAATLVASVANAQPAFEKAFAPSTIGPGSVSTLTFTIDNTTGSAVTDLDFTDTLPAGMTIATPASAMTTCVDGLVSAPDGGTTISLSNGRLGASSSCTVTVNVRATATRMNESGDLTSSAGNSGTAMATLTVDDSLPGFSKSFSPSSIPPGGTSTLTFAIDNTSNAAGVGRMLFTDVLPTGMVIASPANASTDCSFIDTFTGTPGTSVIFLFAQGSLPAFPVVPAGSLCTVTVDVTTTTTGVFVNTSGELLIGPQDEEVSSGVATAVLNVPVDFLIKSFTDDPVPPGGTVTLEFTITNLSRDNGATNIAFTDDLSTILPGTPDVTATGLPAPGAACNGGTITGTSVLSFTGGSLPPNLPPSLPPPPESSCMFSVTLEVPSGAASGTFTNTTSAITADIGGVGVTGNMATDNLVVEPAPLLTKSFTDDPVGAGDTVALEFTITNTSPSLTATDIAFEDVFDVILPTASSVPAAGSFCGGATATFTPLVDLMADGAIPARLTVSGGSLVASADCTFDITLDVAVGTPAGTYPNTTSAITATVDGMTVTGNPASDDLLVVAAPRMTKEFTDDPVDPGGTVTLEFTLENLSTTDAATDITFSDDLDGAVTGLAATGLPMSDICGAGSQITGTTDLIFTDGSLTAGESCTFSLTLQVPASAPPGPHTNMTSSVVATVLGVTATENGASNDLMIGGLTFTKSFTDDPVIPGGTVTLEFTLANTSTTDNATGIFFLDLLDPNVLPGLTVVGPLPTTPCGAGSVLVTFDPPDPAPPEPPQIQGLSLTGGNLLAGGSCTFNVTLLVPAPTVSDTYGNTTSNLSATIGGTATVLPPATDALTVDSNLLSLTKFFTDDPVAPGGTVTLEFTLSNLDTSNTATGIAFTDDLDAVLTGLVATGLPAPECGGTISGTGVLTFTGGSLAPGASCTFSVTVIVPAGAAIGIVTNTTTAVTGIIGGLGVTGDPATDDLRINVLFLSKAFASSAEAGGTVALSFTIQNLDTTTGASDLAFADDLDAALSGLVVTGGLPADPCGTGSVLTGTSLLTLTGGNLLPGGFCTFPVDLQVPATPLAGSFLNVSSDLRQGSVPVAEPASATLVVATQITNRVTVTAEGVLPAQGQTTDTIQP